MHWFRDLDPKLQVAVVASAVSIAAALITAVSTAVNVGLKAWLDGRSARQRMPLQFGREVGSRRLVPVTALLRENQRSQIPDDRDMRVEQ